MMAYLDQITAIGGPAGAACTFIDTVLRRLTGMRSRWQGDGHYRAGPLDAATMRDTGARREYQDYAPFGIVPVCPARRIHQIAEAARWMLPH
jgi:hypothetical protein